MALDIKVGDSSFTSCQMIISYGRLIETWCLHISAYRYDSVLQAKVARDCKQENKIGYEYEENLTAS